MNDIEATHAVQQVMSRGALWVDESATVRSVATMLADTHIGVAFVRRQDGSAGIVSERDLVRLIAGNPTLSDLVFFARANGLERRFDRFGPCGATILEERRDAPRSRGAPGRLRRVDASG